MELFSCLKNVHKSIAEKFGKEKSEEWNHNYS